MATDSPRPGEPTMCLLGSCPGDCGLPHPGGIKRPGRIRRAARAIWNHADTVGDIALGVAIGHHVLDDD